MAAMLTPMITEQVMTASILLLELRAAIILSGTALTRVTRMLLVSASVTLAARLSTTNSRYRPMPMTASETKAANRQATR